MYFCNHCSYCITSKGIVRHLFEKIITQRIYEIISEQLMEIRDIFLFFKICRSRGRLFQFNATRSNRDFHSYVLFNWISHDNST